MPIVRVFGKFYNTEGSLEDFILTNFSDDLATFVMPENNEFSCNNCSDSGLDFLMKYKATHKINPRHFDKGLSAIEMPESDSNGNELNYIDSDGESDYFQSIVKEHCDYVAKDETEVRDVANIIYQKKSYVTFSHDDFDSYLAASFKEAEWGSYLANKDGKKWRNYVFKLLNEKLLHDFSFSFKRSSLVEAYRHHGKGFRARLLEVSSVKKYEKSEKNELMQAFGKDPDFKDLF